MKERFRSEANEEAVGGLFPWKGGAAPLCLQG